MSSVQGASSGNQYCTHLPNVGVSNQREGDDSVSKGYIDLEQLVAVDLVVSKALFVIHQQIDNKNMEKIPSQIHDDN